MKKIMISTVAVIFLFSATMAFAQPWGSRGMGPGYGMPRHMASSLNLTQEQSDKLKKLNEDYLTEITPLKNRLLTKRAEMRLFWEEANSAREKILAKQEEVNEIQRQLEEKATMHRLELQSILTPEQRSKMVEFGSEGGWGHGPVGKVRGR